MTYPTDERLAELTDKLEKGILELYSSGKYAAYLAAMSKFHHYSFGNALLILLQCPHATHVAGCCNDISWAEAQPGDLAFYPNDDHIGIVCGWDENGNILIVHCASGQNNVVITGKREFISVARPIYYDE